MIQLSLNQEQKCQVSLGPTWSESVPGPLIIKKVGEATKDVKGWQGYKSEETEFYVFMSLVAGISLMKQNSIIYVKKLRIVPQKITNIRIRNDGQHDFW